MQDFKQLRVWQAARQLRNRVYAVTRSFPVDERFGLVAQLRDAAGSVTRNIAEGTGRQSDADFKRFLHNAIASLQEVEDGLIQAVDCGYLDAQDARELFDQVTNVRRMLAGLIKRLR
jgi:four helix bundle protein